MTKLSFIIVILIISCLYLSQISAELCGTIKYNPKYQLCCDMHNPIEIVGNKTKCCGSTAYDPYLKGCCGSTIYNKNKMTYAIKTILITCYW